MHPTKTQSSQPAYRKLHGTTGWLFVICGLVCLTLLWFVSGPIPQDLQYHDFADQRPIFWIPHALNVISNAFFLLAGCLGLWSLRQRRLDAPEHRGLYAVFFVGIGLIGLGSAYYHWSPDNVTLVWDRLPMTLGFMAFTALVFYERVSRTMGKTMFPWLILLGLFSVIYWAVTDDLRPYAAVQFIPMLALPFVIWFTNGPGTNWLWLTLACYAIAKLLDVNDQAVMDLSAGLISGHTLKHMVAALGALMVASKVRCGEVDIPDKES